VSAYEEVSQLTVEVVDFDEVLISNSSGSAAGCSGAGTSGSDCLPSSVGVAFFSSAGLALGLGTFFSSVQSSTS